MRMYSFFCVPAQEQHISGSCFIAYPYKSRSLCPSESSEMNILRPENLLDIICCFSHHCRFRLAPCNRSITLGAVCPPFHPKLKVDTIFGTLCYNKKINGVENISQSHCSMSLSESFKVGVYQFYVL